MSLTGPRRSAQSGSARSLAVFLHGYGADGNDLIGLADVLGAELPDTAFLAPNAPERCTTNPMGFQWFPIPWLDGSTDAARDAGIAASALSLSIWLDAAMAAEAVQASRTALIGFSQGTMIALHVGLRRSESLAGVVGFSGMLLHPETLVAEIVTRPPVLLIHGDADPVVPYARLAEAQSGLVTASVPVETHTSRGIGHGIAPDGLAKASQFLRRVLQEAPRA